MSFPFLQWGKEFTRGGRGSKSGIITNATSVEGARHLLNTISKSVSLNITDKDIPVINEIVKQIYNRMNQYGIEQFSDIQTVRNSKVLASVEDNILKLNLAVLRNPDTYWNKEQKFLQKYGVRFSAVEGKNDVVRATIDHELGHIVYNNSKYADKNKYVSNILSRNSIGRNAPIYKISSYASTSGDSHEFFAESFAMYNHKNAKNNLTSEIRDMVKNISTRK